MTPNEQAQWVLALVLAQGRDVNTSRAVSDIIDGNGLTGAPFAHAMEVQRLAINALNGAHYYGLPCASRIRAAIASLEEQTTP